MLYRLEDPPHTGPSPSRTSMPPARTTSFRIRLLVGCDGLEADASRFRWRKDHSQPNNSTCKFCHSEPEDPFHFIAKCPALSPVRSRLLSATPETVKPHLPDLEADPLRFTEVVLDLEWVKDTPTQTFIIDFHTMVCKQCQNCVFINDKQVQNGVADIGMVQPISS